MRFLAQPVLAAGLAAALGCGAQSPVAPLSSLGSAAARSGVQAGPGCSFLRGVNTCVATTVNVESSTHDEVSACVAFDGTEFVAGRRTRSFLDQIQITETTTTLQHGLRGSVFEASTERQTVLLSSTQVSDSCVPL